ncbi:MAG: hypothetical protein U0X91_18640 [Spirosomataceae bacterium]
MKTPSRIILTSLLSICGLLFFETGSFAQTPKGWSKESWDEAVAGKSAKLILNSDKELLEASEVCNLNIQLISIPGTDADNETPGLLRELSYQNLPTGQVTPYKTTNWSILEGGGNLITDNNTATFTAPNSAPKGKKIVISVDLEPQSPNLPKIQLLKTIYFTENETAVTLHVPSIGIMNAKFTSNNDGGVGSRAKGNIPQVAYEATKSRGYNLNALTSNAMLIYEPNQNLSILRFSSLTLEALDSDGSKEMHQGIATLAVSFRGRGKGTFALDDKEVGLILYLASMQKGCGCGKDAAQPDEKFDCHGKVTITKDDGKEVEGNFNATVFTDDGKNIVKGRIQGKFKALKAN